ncbi:MAG: carbamoyl phosphate synthase large subunit, partial [Rickettsiales bacterium]
KAELAAGTRIPQEGTAFLSVKDSDKDVLPEIARELLRLGFTLIATRGTQAILAEQEIPCATVNKVRQGRPHIVDLLKDGKVQLVINTTEGAQSIADSFSIRRTSLSQKITYCTTVEATRALLKGIEAMKNGGGLNVRPLQSYFSKTAGKVQASA